MVEQSHGRHPLNKAHAKPISITKGLKSVQWDPKLITINEATKLITTGTWNSHGIGNVRQRWITKRQRGSRSSNSQPHKNHQ